MKRIIAFLLAAALCMGASAAMAESANTAIILPAAHADYSRDKGISPENKKTAAKYDKETQMIWNLAKGAEITYTVPEGVEGNFDIYITLSKTLAEFTSQPFCFRIADGEVYSVPVDCQVPATVNSSDSCYTGEITDKGRFLIAENATLQGGDMIQVFCTFGAKDPKLKGEFFPGVGDVELVSAGTAVGVGYDYVVPEQEVVDSTDPLSGKTILWLGSSVTYGAHAAGHYSMVDAVADLHPALVCEKYAISATTLVNQSDSSYVSRLRLIPRDKKVDLVVVQLSTNDATTGKPFGEVGSSFAMEDFDDTTIAGAIETIIAYSRDAFQCPVVFYTGTFCEKENYPEMVQLLHQIEEKWNIGVIDMFNNEEMTAVFGTQQYEAWMGDQVHPNRDGYTQWWTPVIDAYLMEYMEK